MRLLLNGLVAVLALLLPGMAAAAEEMPTMYGAAWCGPCKALKRFLELGAVAYRYVDVDTDGGREAYERERPSQGGIPLLVVGREKIVGADLPRIAAVLSKAGLGPKAGRDAGKPQGESYGGHPPSWWQSQFRALRGRQAALEARVKTLEDVAFDDHEKADVVRLKADLRLVVESIDVLENDASNVSLPRKFRE